MAVKDMLRRMCGGMKPKSDSSKAPAASSGTTPGAASAPPAGAPATSDATAAPGTTTAVPDTTAATSDATAAPTQTPAVGGADEQQKPIVEATASNLTISLLNHTGTNPVYAFITGTDSSNRLFILQADGHTPYYPSSPSSTGQHLQANCAIPLAAPNQIKNVTIPYLSGARLWFSIGTPLTFLLNPGPGLVEPSPTNPSDANLHIKWDFCEFTFGAAQLYANITYVDFVSIPIALTLSSASGPQQHVSGMDQNGLTNVCAGLRAQTEKDGRRWSSLIVNGPNGQPIRAISPNNGIVGNPGWFSLNGGYWSEYVTQVWNKYRSQQLQVNTQTGSGTLNATVGANNELNFPGGISFREPSTPDIFSNSTGPFVVTGGVQGAIVARLAAAFNRSTLLTDNLEPNLAADPSHYYKNPITNHYARLVHQYNLDGRGYAFPYDDVTPAGGKDQSGFVASGNPTNLLVGVGGIGAHT